MKKKKNRTLFGDRARKMRKSLGVTLTHQANHMNVSLSRLTQVECGYKSITPKMVQRYAEFFRQKGHPDPNTIWRHYARYVNNSIYFIQGFDELSTPKRNLLVLLAECINEIDDKDASILLKQAKRRVEHHYADKSIDEENAS